MKSVYVFCLYLFVTAPIFGQSNPASRVVLPTAPPSRLGLPQSSPFGPGRTQFQATADVARFPQTPGSIFEVPTLYRSGGQYALSVAVGDVNQDGKLDLVMANDSGVGVLLGNGDGTFQPAVTYSSGGTAPYAVAVGDVNGDGKPDVVVTNPSGPNATVGVLLGNGNGTFQPAVVYDTGGRLAYSVALGDVNGDGNPDIVVANVCDSSTGCNYPNNGTIGVLLGTPAGFSAELVYSSGGEFAQSVAIGDVNGDGKPDLLVANWCAVEDFDCSYSNGTVSVLLGDGLGGFQNSGSYDSGGHYGYSVAVGDVDGDGKPDLIVSNQTDESSRPFEQNGTVSVLPGNGDGTFRPALTYSSGGFIAISVAQRDVNGDGKPDLLVANECATTVSCSNGGVAVFLGNGNGTFQGAVIYAPGGYLAYSLAVSDVNQDGKPDVIAANQCDSLQDCNLGSDTGEVGVLLGNGDGTFQAALAYNSGGENPTSVTVGDVNGDGIPDLLVALQCASNTDCSTGGVGVLLGNGDGTFQTAVNYSSGGESASSVAIGDMNGDGNPDLLIANVCASSSDCSTGGAAVLLGNGNGTFQAAVSYSSGGYVAHWVAVGDVNGDGKPDVLVANELAANVNSANGTAAVLLGNGDGTLRTAVTYASGGMYTLSVAVADLNADGKPDLLVENQCASQGNCTSSTMSVLLGNGDGTFQTAKTATTPPFGSIIGSGAVALADFNGDGKLDVASGSGEFVLLGNGDGTFQTAVALGAGGVGIATGDFNRDGKPDLAVGGITVLLNISPGGATAVISPTSINFGNQTVGIASASQMVTLTNTGNATLNLSSIALSASNGSVGQTNTCGSSVAAGASCVVTLSWIPGGTGNMTGTLTFTDNASNSPQVVSLSGVGVLPAVTLSPAKLIFSTQVVFTTSAAQTATLTNTGLGILSISKISVTGPFSQANTCGTSVTPGGSCTFTVRFTPTTIGTITGSVSITDNALNSPQTLALTGFGTYLRFNPTSLDFGNERVGIRSAPKRITMTNKGSVAVSITSFSIVGTNPGDFAETSTCGTSLAAGASCVITVTFKPLARGNRTAAVWVTDNGGGSPQKISVIGTGR